MGMLQPGEEWAGILINEQFQFQFQYNKKQFSFLRVTLLANSQQMEVDIRDDFPLSRRSLGRMKPALQVRK